MNVNTLQTNDGVELRYAFSIADGDKPWIALVIPFGLDVEMANPFFDFFRSHYNLCTFESRRILENTDNMYEVDEFSIDKHVADLIAVLDTVNARESILTGYCSGAGVALAAINRWPNRFSDLILSHGEYTLLQDEGCTTPFAADMDGLLGLASSSDKRAETVFNKIEAEKTDADSNRPAGLDRPFSELRYLKRYANNYLAYKSVDYKQLASEVLHPTLVMAGDKDIQVNINSSKKIHELIKNADIFVDPDADHYGVLTPNSNTMIAIWNYICQKNYARNHYAMYS